jgi:hypothetical protein
MKNFAKIENGIVTTVLVVPKNESGRGQLYLSEDLGLGGEWVSSGLGKSPNPGDAYDKSTGVFISPIADEVQVVELTILEKLAAIGLTVEDLKELLK